MQIPMLTNYVLNRCRSWSDLLKVVLDLREGRPAREFRKDIDRLLNAVDSRDNAQVDEILSKLEAAADAWSRSLHQVGPKRRVKINIPFVGIGTEFHVPDIRLQNRPGDAILVFIHEVLSGA